MKKQKTTQKTKWMKKMNNLKEMQSNNFLKNTAKQETT